MKKIRTVDLTRQYEVIRTEVTEKVLSILQSGRYIGGETVTNFESEFAEYIGSNYCVGCNSGTDALYMALRAFNIGEGDEVITTPFSFIATSEVIVRVGAKPVFVDVEDSGFNFDLEKVKEAITDKTKAIIPVHLFGQPVDMTELVAIAKSHNICIIEDCAQATGAKWENKKVGSIGDVGCFSFFPTKNLGGCGDGGALTTDNKEIANKIKLIREHGLIRDNSAKVSYRHELTGLNSRLDAIQAAILSIKLRYLDSWNERRQKAAFNYERLLKSTSNIKLPVTNPQGFSVYNQYTILVQDTKEGCQLNRDILKAFLEEGGISSMVYYPLPLHLQPVYSNLGYKEGDLPNVERISKEVLSLPMFPDLSLEEQEIVVDRIIKWNRDFFDRQLQDTH